MHLLNMHRLHALLNAKLLVTGRVCFQ